MKAQLNKFFIVFLFSIFCVFFIFRPLNSQWYRIITADGLGYYSYLPAKFIYNDSNLDFKWFNEVYPKYYAYNAFATPAENFTAKYKDKFINKYFPALSFLLLPFFLIAHLLAKLFGLPADGFSAIYQVSMGLAAVFYASIGLWFLRRLLFKLFKDELIALVVPIAIFFGTNVFSYTIFIGSFSHIYSFSFIIISLYYCYCFFNGKEERFKNFLLFALCSAIVVLLRPFNVLFLLAVPAFIPKQYSFKFPLKPFTLQHGMIVLTLIALIIYQFGILYTQTGSFFPYTYSGERFYFNKAPHIFEVLFCYQSGMFVYVPLVFISLLGVFFIGRKKQFLLLVLLLIIVIVLYSYWWYWAILTRTIVDFTGVLAILLALFLFGIKQNKNLFRTMLILIFISVTYFQLKAYQLRNLILDPNYTYKEYFWEHFFTIHPINAFPVPPKTIIEEKTYADNDEATYAEKQFDGKKTMLLNAQSPFSKAYKYKLHDFFKKEGYKKIKSSFHIYFEGDISSLQLVYQFYNGTNAKIAYLPFYMNKDKIRFNQWEYKEFGCDLPGEVSANDSISIFFWNNENKEKVFISNVKHQFLLTNDSYEMKMLQ